MQGKQHQRKVIIAFEALSQRNEDRASRKTYTGLNKHKRLCHDIYESKEKLLKGRVG